MEEENKIRQFIRKTLLEVNNRLNEVTLPVRANESGIVQEEPDDKLDENTLDDKDLKGVDKILAKSNDRLK